MLLERLGEHNLVGHLALLVAVVLDGLLLLGNRIFLCPAVQDEHHDIELVDFIPLVELFEVFNVAFHGLLDVDVVEVAELSLELVDHPVDVFFQVRGLFLDDQPVKRLLLEVEQFGTLVLLDVVLVLVLLPVLVVSAH